MICLRSVQWRTAIRAGLAASLLAASAACSPSRADKAGPTATVATEPPTTATINPYAVPPVIDAAYVNRVLAGLDAVVGDVVRLIFRTKTISREAFDRMRAVYADPDRLQREIDGFQRDMRNGFPGYRPEPGNRFTAVTQMITATPACIFARVSRDYSAVGTTLYLM